MTNKLKKISVNYVDQKWSQGVKKRDFYQCQLCGAVHSLEAHHINKRDNFVTRWRLENGITLCKDCHNKAGKLLDMKIRYVIGAERFDREAYLASKTLKDYCFELGIPTMEYRIQCLLKIKDKINEYDLR